MNRAISGGPVLSRCEKCGFEAATVHFLSGVCHGCRIMAGEVKHGEKREKRAAEMAICACGCGQSFEKYDDHGRPRKYAKRSHQWTEERKAKMMGYAKKNGLGKYERPTPSPPRQP